MFVKNSSDWYISNEIIPKQLATLRSDVSSLFFHFARSERRVQWHDDPRNSLTVLRLRHLIQYVWLGSCIAVSHGGERARDSDFL